MSDEVPIYRHWLLLRTLGARRHGLTVREMAREMKVADKTIRRDLMLFQRLGFPLEETNGERGRKTWRIGAGVNAPPLQFTFDEAVVLYLFRPFLEPLAGTQLWEAAHNALRKIRATLDERAIAYLEKFPQLFHCTTFELGDYSSKAGIIDELHFAIEERKAVHIAYQSLQATEPATREVYPYSLARYRGWLYLVAFDPAHDRIRHYKVDRIETIEVSSFTFQRPADFDVAKHFAGSFGIFEGDRDVTVVVKIMPPASRRVIESKRLPGLVLTNQGDGSVLARFRFSSTGEIKEWILGFGASAVVLEPEDLRAEICQELEQLLNVYQGAPTNNPQKAFQP